MLGRYLHALTRPLPAYQALDRESSRSALLFACFGIVIATLPLPARTDIHWTATSWVLGVIVTVAMASLVPACWPVLNRVGGLVVASGIFALTAATGWSSSPYVVLYGVLALYAAMFYATHRLVLTLALVLLLLFATHVIPNGVDGALVMRSPMVRLLTWGAVVMVAHGLMRRIRAQSTALITSEERYRALFNANPDGVISLDQNGRFTEVNAAAAELVSRSPEELLGTHFGPLIDRGDVATAQTAFHGAMNGAPQEIELRLVDRDDRRVFVVVTAMPITVRGEVRGLHAVVKDITATKELQIRLEYLALHDPLTGIPNRRLFTDRLDREVAKLPRAEGPLAVVMVDLDGFKTVNDTHGHAVGDQLLVEVAARLTACLRAEDTVARVGGDEFAVILPGADQATADDVAERIRQTLATPVPTSRGPVTVRASIGTAVSDCADQTVAGLLSAADAAMYALKRGSAPAA